jgi:hypothetical protein
MQCSIESAANGFGPVQGDKMKHSVSCMAIVVATGMASSMAFAADAPATFEEKFEGVKPAVSAINGKIEAAYTYIDVDNVGDTNMGDLAGAISIPIGQQFGLQIDGGVATANDIGTGFGAAVHAFWRNPDMALLGFYGDVVRYDTDFGPDVTTWRYGAEAELYLDRVSLEGFIGGDSIDAGGFSDTYFSAEALAAFYVTDDFRIHAGVGHRFENTYGIVGAEAILPFASRNVALFGDGTFGDDVSTARVGLRVYFGEAGKSLKGRHREDDPRIRLFDFTGFGVEEEEPACKYPCYPT